VGARGGRNLIVTCKELSPGSTDETRDNGRGVGNGEAAGAVCGGDLIKKKGEILFR
jgi:hypothetical protein